MGFQKKLRNADIIIVTDPDQVHLGKDNQKIISYINKVFLDEQYGHILVNNYKRIETMKIGEVNIYFYERIDNVTEDEYKIFVEEGIQYIN